MSPVGADMLGRIVARTRERLREKKQRYPIERVMSQAVTPGARRAFARALADPGGINVIAEYKRRSPSRGVIREDLHPVLVAQGYEIAGAAALSVLTEEEFFGGSIVDLQEARAATLMPALRKDFIVDAYQVREAWIAGADAILLIVAILADHELRQLHEMALGLGLEVLVEVHDAEELTRALAAQARVVGVNNRDLRTQQVRLETSLELVDQLPDDVVAVSESGLRSGADLRRLRDAGFDAFLVGEHLMASEDPGLALESLLREAAAPAAGS